MSRSDALTPFILTFEHRPHYLYANVKGDHDNYLVSTLYWEEISKEVKRTGYKKVLVYEELLTNASRTDVFQSICSFRPDDFAGIQIAFVDRYPDHEKINDFAFQVAQKKGFNLENFYTIEDAERWLIPFDFAA